MPRLVVRPIPAPRAPAEPRAPTGRQLEIHEFMLDFYDAHGAPPSLRQIAAFIGAHSTNAVNDHMKSMANKGLVRHNAMRSRCWVPIRKEPQCDTPET